MCHHYYHYYHHYYHYNCYYGHCCSFIYECMGEEQMKETMARLNARMKSFQENSIIICSGFHLFSDISLFILISYFTSTFISFGLYHHHYRFCQFHFYYYYYYHHCHFDHFHYCYRYYYHHRSGIYESMEEVQAKQTMAKFAARMYTLPKKRMIICFLGCIFSFLTVYGVWGSGVEESY